MGTVQSVLKVLGRLGQRAVEIHCQEATNKEGAHLFLAITNLAADQRARVNPLLVLDEDTSLVR
jgi:hypothetical protein